MDDTVVHYTAMNRTRCGFLRGSAISSPNNSQSQFTKDGMLFSVSQASKEKKSENKCSVAILLDTISWFDLNS